MLMQLDDWQKRTLVYGLTCVVVVVILSFTPAPDFASALAGTEPMSGWAVAGLTFVVARFMAFVFVPVGVIAVALSLVFQRLLVRRSD